MKNVQTFEEWYAKLSRGNRPKVEHARTCWTAAQAAVLEETALTFQELAKNIALLIPPPLPVKAVEETK